MASVTEDFDAFVALDLDSPSNPQPWPTVPSGGLSMHHVSGEVRIRTEAVVRNRHPTAMDTADHSATIQMVAFHAGNLEYAGPAVRMGTDVGDWYNIACNGAVLGVEKYLNGSYDETFAASFTNYVSHAVAEGDFLEILAYGTDPVQIEVRHNGALVTALGTSGVISDASATRITTNTGVGLFGYSETTDQTLAMDMFSAQDEGGSTPQHYTLTAEFGSYSLSGQEVDLAASGGLTAEAGSYTLLGSDAMRDIEMDADAGDYDLTGQDVDLLGTAILSAEFGSYDLIGQAAALIYSTAASIATPKGQRRFFGFRLNR